MKQIRKSSERGHAHHGWLDARHSFSFGNYYDPDFMGFRSLRVINEDHIAAASGFPTHPHQNMEILTYVIDGSLEHKDSLGSGSTIHPGDIQRMSAGSGVRHSEFNPSKTETLHLLQIWLLPNAENIEPPYEERSFAAEQRAQQLRLMVSGAPGDDAVFVHQDIKLYSGLFFDSQLLQKPIDENRHYWLQVISGIVALDGERLEAGDAMAIEDEKELNLSIEGGAHFLLFDLA